MAEVSLVANLITLVDFTAKTISYLNSIKDAPKERAKCAVEASIVFNLLTNLRYRLEEATSGSPWFIAVHALAVDNGPFDQFRTGLEELMSRLTPAEGLKKIGKALIWKLDKAEVTGILSRMEHLKSLIQIALEMDHFKLSQAIKMDTTAMKHDTMSIKHDTVSIKDDTTVIKHDTTALRGGIFRLENGVERIHQCCADAEHNKVADWLTPIDYAVQHNDVITQRQEGTGLWFLESPKFTDWLNGAKRTLFCPGIPGAGKTIMTSMVIDHLWRSVKNRTIGIAYLYCNFKRQKEQRAIDLLSALLKQLVQECSSMPQCVTTLYEHHAKQRTRPSIEDISGALHSVAGGYSRVYFVIDALDECSSSQRIATSILFELRSLQAQADVRLMVTSRDNPIIKQEFDQDMSLEVRASDADVQRYLEQQMPQLSRCVQQNLALQETIKEEIIKAVRGMFLLAKLHLESLRDKKTAKAVKSALGRLPEAYERAYGEAVGRIDSQSQGERDLAQNVISWIVNAKTPLTTTELQIALAIEPGEPKLDDENFPDVEDMVSVCLGLVTVDDESYIIRLVHCTTQEYFESLAVDWLSNAPRIIASKCITYLSFDVFASGPCPTDEEYGSRLAHHQFLVYAASHWGDLARGVEEQVKGLAVGFLQSEEKVSSLNQVARAGHYRRFSQFYAKQQKGLHIVACSNLQLFMKCILEADEFADNKDSFGQTPLSLASEAGHATVVKMLLDQHDVNADAKNKSGQIPLSLASKAGHEAVVKLLLDRHDVNADAKDKSGQTPLLLALKAGHDTVVKMLLERHDVNADARGEFGRTPLSWASKAGNEAVVKLLLDRHDVNADARDEFGQTPLSLASWAGFFFWTSVAGHDAVVKLLLGQGDVDPNSADFGCQTALHHAVSTEHTTTARLLLHHNADANPKDREGQTPLFLAIKFGYKTITKLLLAHGADVNTKNNRGQEPLFFAVDYGNAEIVKLLLDHCADANVKDEQGQTPLFLAVRQKEDEVIKTLLGHGADTNVQDRHGQTPLFLAVMIEHVEVIELLLNYLLRP